MAREKQTGEPKGIEVNCTFCGYREMTVSPAGETTNCPSCGEAFSIHVTDRFTLVENDGWAVTVSLEADAPSERLPAGERP